MSESNLNFIDQLARVTSTDDKKKQSNFFLAVPSKISEKLDQLSALLKEDPEWKNVAKNLKENLKLVATNNKPAPQLSFPQYESLIAEYLKIIKDQKVQMNANVKVENFPVAITNRALITAISQFLMELEYYSSVGDQSYKNLVEAAIAEEKAEKATWKALTTGLVDFFAVSEEESTEEGEKTQTGVVNYDGNVYRELLNQMQIQAQNLVDLATATNEFTAAQNGRLQVLSSNLKKQAETIASLPTLTNALPETVESDGI